MLRKISAILASCALVLSLTACGGGNDSGDSTSATSSGAGTSKQEESSAPESASSAFVPEDDGVYYDLEAVYDAIIEAQPEGAKLPPMKRVTDMNIIKELYEGIENVEAMQIVLYMSEDASVPCEVMLVEAPIQRGADYLVDPFLDRIDEGADNEENPDIAMQWVNNAELQQEGRFIAMVMLPDGCDVPSNVFWLLDE